MEKQAAKKVKSVPPRRRGAYFAGLEGRETSPRSYPFQLERRGLHANIRQLLEPDNPSSLPTISEHCCGTRVMKAQRRRPFVTRKHAGCCADLRAH